MFDAVVRHRPRRALRLTLAASASAHVFAIAFAVVASAWTITRLTPRAVPVVWAAPPAPPPAPPAAAPTPPAPKPVAAAPRPARAATPAPAPVVQPVRPSDVTPTDAPPAQIVAPPGDKPSVVKQDGSDGTGDDTVPPQTIAIHTLAALRVAGEAEVRLPRDVLQAMSSQRIDRAEVAVRLCLSSAGVPTTVTVMKGSGFAAADEHVRNAVSAWRYRPYEVNTRPVPVCTAVVFRYEIE